jgi:adenylate kinase family enzyme
MADCTGNMKKRYVCKRDMNEDKDLSFFRRINVIGTSGSGKSTFSKELAAKMDIPYLEMDKIFWGPDWTLPEDEVFFKKLESKLSGDGWVLDGNYTRTTAIKWQKVELVIWLDFSLFIVMSRIISRAIGRVVTQVELWEGTGNRESFKKLFSRDSIVLWSWNTYRSNRKKYTEMMADENFSHIKFVRLREPREAQELLDYIDKTLKSV